MHEPFDPRVAHPARVYSYWLGGKDHYLADREAGDEVARHRPEVVAAARANRAFGQRVTGYAAAGLRIRQFLDIGAGLPAHGPTHEIAQKISPACRVVYADNDPLVLAHGRALLTGSARRRTVHVPARRRPRPGRRSWSRPSAVLDYSRPVAVLLLAVLHFLADDRRRGRDRRATGSRVSARQPDRDLAPDRRLRAPGHRRQRRGLQRPRPGPGPPAKPRPRSPPSAVPSRSSTPASSRSTSGCAARTSRPARPSICTPRCCACRGGAARRRSGDGYWSSPRRSVSSPRNGSQRRRTAWAVPIRRIGTAHPS